VQVDSRETLLLLWLGSQSWPGRFGARPNSRRNFQYARVRGAPATLSAAVFDSAAAFTLHIAAARYFRITFYYGLLFPLGYTAGALMAFDSVRRRLRGRVSWEGRIYP
jgi:hypothetical protein